eukprot:scaffold7356_cov19-Tisochrysis_lutea.AAC.1
MAIHRSQYIHERAPYQKSILLYGAERTGKTLLSQPGGAPAWKNGIHFTSPLWKINRDDPASHKPP